MSNTDQMPINEVSQDALSVYTCTRNKCVDLSILLELGSIGAGHAATSLSDILQQQVTIDVPKIHTLPPHQLPNFFNRHDTPTTAIYLQLSEVGKEIDCDILLMFEVNEAKKIAALMTMTPSIEELDPSMETSAIQELANILIGSFLSAISDFINVKLMPTPPLWLQNTFDAIIDDCLIKQAAISDQALIFDTCFKANDGAANSMLLIFPSPKMLDLLVQKSKELTGDVTKEPDEPKIVYPDPNAFSITPKPPGEN